MPPVHARRRLRPRPPATLGTALLAGLLAACASTTLPSVWRAKEAPTAPYRSLLVVRISAHPGSRAVFEERMAGALAARGVRAQPGRELLPGLTAPGALTPARVRTAAAELDVEGVLATHLVRVRRELEVVPGMRRGPFLVYDELLWEDLEPDRVRDTETVVLETNLYDAGGRLVWSAVSETFAPASREVLAREVAARVVARLAADGLVP